MYSTSGSSPSSSALYRAFSGQIVLSNVHMLYVNDDLYFLMDFFKREIVSNAS
jgi:hypothetical protein